MKDKSFIDTNIFYYCFDANEVVKRKKANQLIRDLLYGHSGIVSIQVIQEFLNVVTKKMPGRFKQEDLDDYLQAVLWPMCVSQDDKRCVDMAMSCHFRYKISFYDALIISSASLSGCRCVYSEDLQHGSIFLGVKIINPFL